ncbi:MAG: type II secretion system F family protein [Kiloniellales bacterium]|nr:type II secretion system F family protein [Kiloniellales bacterium]
MPTFHYKSVAESGEVVEGQLEASDQTAAVARLQRLGHVPLKIDSAASGLSLDFLKQDVSFRRGLGTRDITTVTRQVATLLGAGLPLDRALDILVEMAEQAPQRRLVAKIVEEVRGGATLADALDKQEETFPVYYRSMVRAGEAGATLEAVLGRLADFMERSQAMRAQVRSSLIYPTILLVFAGLSLAVMLTFVVPTFKPLLDDAGTELPLSTQIVIAAGDVFEAYWWLMLLGAVAAFFGARAALARPATRLWCHRHLLRLPLAGQLWVKIDVARFARTLSTLLSNGVVLLSALALTRDVLSNAALADLLGRIEPDVKAGRGLAEPLAESGLFPILAVQLLRVGEESGHLEEMLAKLAEIYDADAATTIQRLLALLVPMLTLGLGLLIAFIIASILMALFSINELVL